MRRRRRLAGACALAAAWPRAGALRIDLSAPPAVDFSPWHVVRDGEEPAAPRLARATPEPTSRLLLYQDMRLVDIVCAMTARQRKRTLAVTKTTLS